MANIVMVCPSQTICGIYFVVDFPVVANKSRLVLRDSENIALKLPAI